jgi:putative nucleotidyltransferase with HDIG domain
MRGFGRLVKIPWRAKIISEIAFKPVSNPAQHQLVMHTEIKIQPTLIMLRNHIHTALFCLAASLALLAQGFLFAPAWLEALLQPLPRWGNSTYGFLLFFTALSIWVLLLRSQPYRTATNWILIAIQFITTPAIFFLRDGFASQPGEIWLLFPMAITTLTTLGILTSRTLNPQIAKIAIPEPNPEAERTIPNEEPILYTESNTHILRQQMEAVTRKLTVEKHRTTQLTFLNDLSQQLETELDPPVAAQLAVNMLERSLDCSFVSLLRHEPDSHEFIALATAGKDAGVTPPGYRQSAETGVLGRTARLRKTQLVNETKLDPDFLLVGEKNVASMIAVPILHNGQVKGVIEVCAARAYAFNNLDVNIVEGAALELTRAWERSSYNQRLTELIQAGISLATLLDPQAAVQSVATLAQKTLEARFVFITLLDQQGNFSRTASAGEAPKLLQSLNTSPAQEPVIQAALNSNQPFRVRDVRKYASHKNVEIDHGGLRSALAIPIRLHRLSIGAIIAFGKQDGVFFSENDESLADLLASQAAAAIESAWLYQELRTTVNTTSLLYRLSLDVTQTDNLTKAAEYIAQAAHRATNARETGIVLLDKNGKIEVEVELDEEGFHTRRKHPYERIDQALQTGQSIYISEEHDTLVCYPLQTRARTIGALWMNIAESRGQNFANIQTLANQAAVTIERSQFLEESLRQAKQIEAAYEELQASYDQTLTALMSALDARDRETEGHSMRVSRVTCKLGEMLGLNNEQLKALERGALLHDIGKIGISDTILHKPGKLTENEWTVMRTHPDIGAHIVDRIPFLQDCMPVVHYHHERWDGSGYPFGLKGQAIPLHARIFAVADVFDALTSRRSYRKRSTPAEAIAYLREQASVLFDPEVVEALATLPYAEFVEAEKTTP